MLTRSIYSHNTLKDPKNEIQLAMTRILNKKTKFFLQIIYQVPPSIVSDTNFQLKFQGWQPPPGFDPGSLGAMKISQLTYPLDHDALQPSPISLPRLIRVFGLMAVTCPKYSRQKINFS